MSQILLQNPTAILLQYAKEASAFLLQNATVLL